MPGLNDGMANDCGSLFECPLRGVILFILKNNIRLGAKGLVSALSCCEFGGGGIAGLVVRDTDC